jgi:hypothetical protein
MPTEAETAGHRALLAAALGTLPVCEDAQAHFRFPRCPHCHRRPELREAKGSWLIYLTGLPDPKHLKVPRYEIVPCCSVKYTVEVNHVTRKEKLRGQSKVA